MKDAYYFPHDSNARNDPRMLLIRAKHGLAGYGGFFMIVEMLRDEETLKIPVNDDLYPMLALGIGATAEFVEKLVDDCVSKGLLKRDTHIYSPSLIRRLEALAERREQKSKAGKKGAQERWKNKGQNSTTIAEHMTEPCQNDGSRTEETEEVDKTHKNNKSGKTAPKKEVSPEAMWLARCLKALILKNDKQARVPEDLTKWAMEADRLIRIDKRPAVEAEGVLKWALRNDFWKSNILSIPKFRQKYTTLKLQMERNGGGLENRVVGAAAPVQGKYAKANLENE